MNYLLYLPTHIVFCPVCILYYLSLFYFAHFMLYLTSVAHCTYLLRSDQHRYVFVKELRDFFRPQNECNARI